LHSSTSFSFDSFVVGYEMRDEVKGWWGGWVPVETAYLCQKLVIIVASRQAGSAIHEFR
jgi:hypothetical protein